MSYVYKSETLDNGDKTYAVGYWRPDGTFAVASRHETPQLARRRVNYLNGGPVPTDLNHSQE